MAELCTGVSKRLTKTVIRPNNGYHLDYSPKTVPNYTLARVPEYMFSYDGRGFFAPGFSLVPAVSVGSRVATFSTAVLGA
jgi:hypothetical protein